MNKQIKRLLEQSGLQPYYDSQQGDIEKFAELIVKEYEQFLPDICPWANADEEGPMKGWHVQFVARKHFGLE
jgi:hypothetical protein